MKASKTSVNSPFKRSEESASKHQLLEIYE